MADRYRDLYSQCAYARVEIQKGLEGAREFQRSIISNETKQPARAVNLAMQAVGLAEQCERTLRECYSLLKGKG